MTHGSGASRQEVATLNNGAAIQPIGSRRRIEHLRQLAYDCNLTKEQARQFGDLRSTATWEKLLTSHGLEFEQKIQITDNTVETASNEAPHQINLMDWLECQQMIALGLASVIFAVLFLHVFPNNRPLQLLPQIKITIQVGK